MLWNDTLRQFLHANVRWTKIRPDRINKCFFLWNSWLQTDKYYSFINQSIKFEQIQRSLRETTSWCSSHRWEKNIAAGETSFGTPQVAGYVHPKGKSSFQSHTPVASMFICMRFVRERAGKSSWYLMYLSSDFLEFYIRKQCCLPVGWSDVLNIQTYWMVCFFCFPNIKSCIIKNKIVIFIHKIDTLLPKIVEIASFYILNMLNYVFIR